MGNAGGILAAIALVGAAGVGIYLYSKAGDIGKQFAEGASSTITDPINNFITNTFPSSDSDSNGNGKQSLPEPTGGQGNPLEPEEGMPQTGLLHRSRVDSLRLLKAQSSAQKVLEYVNPGSQEKLISQVNRMIPGNAANPALTQAKLITATVRKSVGGAKPETNKFYEVFGRTLPLSKEAASYYKNIGVTPKATYL